MNVCNCQAKASRYRKGLTYLKIRASTNKNQTLQSQKLKRKGHKHKLKGNHPKNKERKKGETRFKMAINGKTRFKMAINTYLLIIILDVNGLNTPIKRQRMADWIK